MKSSSGPIKRTGSATNLSTAAASADDDFFVKPSSPPPSSTSVSSVLSKATLTSFSGIIKRTGSANNLSSCCYDEKKPKNFSKALKKTSEMISSVNKSGVMMLVDNNNLRITDTPDPPWAQSSKCLNPSQFFRSNKRSASSSRCSSDSIKARRTAQYLSEQVIRRTPSVDRHRRITRPRSSPSQSAISTSTFIDRNGHLPLEKCRSLPPTPQHSPPSSRKVSVINYFDCSMHSCLMLVLTLNLRANAELLWVGCAAY